MLDMEFVNENQPNSDPPPHATSIAHGHNEQLAIDPGFIERFRCQVHALGGLWIVVGAWPLASVLVIGLTIGTPAKVLGIESSLLLILLTGKALVWIAL
jgi:hypothetical protein